MKTKMQKLNSRMMIGLVFVLMVMFVPAGRAGVLDDFEVTYYHTDHLGNVLAMTDEAGEKVWPADGAPGTDSHGIKVYEPFGPTDESTGSWESGPIFVFTGKEIDRIEVWENHLNINDFGARHHLPETAAFMSPDPVAGNVGNPLSWNRYAFCLNNPVKYVDPDGRTAGEALFPVLGEAIGISIPAWVTPLSVIVVPIAVTVVIKEIVAPGPSVGAGEPYTPDRDLPRNEDGVNVPESDYPHTKLGRKTSSDGSERYPQTREWGDNPRNH